MASMAYVREPILAREDERTRIEEIEDLYEHRRAGKVMLLGPSGEEIELPESVLRLLHQMVTVLSRGEAVSIVPIHKELTTQEAANLLNVSRPYLIRLLEEGEIPFRRTGTHRRIAFGDLMTYRRRRDQERQSGLTHLTQISQELGLYK